MLYLDSEQAMLSAPALKSVGKNIFLRYRNTLFNQGNTSLVFWVSALITICLFTFVWLEGFSSTLENKTKKSQALCSCNKKVSYKVTQLKQFHVNHRIKEKRELWLKTYYQPVLLTGVTVGPSIALILCCDWNSSSSAPNTLVIMSKEDIFRFLAYEDWIS